MLSGSSLYACVIQDILETRNKIRVSIRGRNIRRGGRGAEGGTYELVFDVLEGPVDHVLGVGAPEGGVALELSAGEPGGDVFHCGWDE